MTFEMGPASKMAAGASAATLLLASMPGLAVAGGNQTDPALCRAAVLGINNRPSVSFRIERADPTTLHLQSRRVGGVPDGCDGVERASFTFQYRVKNKATGRIRWANARTDRSTQDSKVTLSQGEGDFVRSQENWGIVRYAGQAARMRIAQSYGGDKRVYIVPFKKD